MITRYLATAAAAAVATATITIAAPSGADESALLRGHVGHAVTTHCAGEDSRNCYWTHDDNKFGDRHGYYAVRVGNEICVIFFDRAHNRKKGHCDPID